LRERKKDATRKALRDAALRLARERGPDNVRVDEIAEAAGVSPRTYNNYFSSREQAIVAAVTADRDARVAAAVAARPARVPLSEAVTDAIVEQYTGTGGQNLDVLPLIASRPALRDAFLATAADIGDPLAAVLTERLGGHSQDTAEVLSASVAAAVRVALERWVQPAAGRSLIVVSGALPDLLRTALAPLAPALDATGARLPLRRSWT
jgi:AcrR family transcriptional regulator